MASKKNSKTGKKKKSIVKKTKSGGKKPTKKKDVRGEPGYPSEVYEGMFKKRVAETQSRMIREALRATDGNVAATARRLGMLRQTLAARMKRLGVDV